MHVNALMSTGGNIWIKLNFNNRICIFFGFNHHILIIKFNFTLNSATYVNKLGLINSVTLT